MGHSRKHSRAQIARALIGKGAGINKLDSRGSTAISCIFKPFQRDFASDMGERDVLELIDLQAATGFEGLVEPSENSRSLPSLFLQRCLPRSCRKLLDLGVQANRLDHESLDSFNSALFCQALDLLDLLWAKNPSINLNECAKSGRIPLVVAASTRAPSIINWCLEKGASPDPSTSWQILSFLLFSPDGPGERRPGQNVALATKMLNEAGLVVDARDECGFTNLHWAAIQTRPKEMQLLVEHGADVNATSKSGITALHLIALLHADHLMEGGIEVCGSQDIANKPALDCLALLLEAGADVTNTVFLNDDLSSWFWPSVGSLKFYNITLGTGSGPLAYDEGYLSRIQSHIGRIEGTTPGELAWVAGDNVLAVFRDAFRTYDERLELDELGSLVPEFFDAEESL